MEFLGFIINKQGVRMDPERIRTISEWKEHPPRSYRDVQVFLRFYNFYRRFIQGYSRIATPLTSLMKGSKDGRKTGDFGKEWGSAQKDAFLELLGAFERAPLLRHYDPARPIRLETDASTRALSGILSQRFEEHWHPIAFYSRQFKGPELNYGTPDQEMLAIVEAFKHWRHYLEGSEYPVEVLTDHHNLQAFMKQPRLNGRQARWCYYLTPYDFTIRWRPGSTNPADAPSRRPDYMAQDEDASQEDTFSGLLATLRAKVARVQQIQVSCRRVLQPHDGEKPCEYDSKSERQAEIRTCEYDSESERQEPRETCEYDRESERQAYPCTGGCELPRQARQRASLGASVTPQEDEVEADHLITRVLAQTITRRRARQAARNEVPQQEPSEGLRQLVAVAQKEDPFCIRVDKDLEKGDSTSTRPQYSRTKDGILLYKGRIVVPNQRSLVHELIELHHDEKSAGHWGIQKTTELLRRKFKWEGIEQDVDEYI